MSQTKGYLHGVELGLFFWKLFEVAEVLEELSSAHEMHDEV